MTKVINKKVLLVLLMLALSFCWFVVPASAEEASNYSDYFAEGETLTHSDETDVLPGRSITECSLRSLTIAAYGGMDENGNPIAYSINGEFGYAQGPAKILNCTVPSTFYQGMVDYGYNYFIGILVFNVEGTDLKRFELRVDGETVINHSLSDSGLYTLTWVSPRKMITSYELVVYSNDNNSAHWGIISIA